MKVVITVDTEEDNQWQLSEVVSSTRNIEYLPRFQKLCERYGLKPTYLCTYGVVNARSFDQTLRGYHREGSAEVGAHLHPWANPPFEGYSPEELSRHPFPSELPENLFQRKLACLTDCIKATIGHRPVCYRAGRWGFCESHISVLLKLGYKIDCSVTPWVSWETTSGARACGPDYTEAPVEPYFLDSKHVCRKGKSELLEVPVTVLFTNPLMWKHKSLCRRLLKYEKTMAGKALNRILRLGRQWFRPFPDMRAGLLEAVYLEACRRELPVVEMMLHSSELMPGGSPYYPTEESVEELYRSLHNLFKFIVRNDGEGRTLSEFRVSHIQELKKCNTCPA